MIILIIIRVYYCIKKVLTFVLSFVIILEILTKGDFMQIDPQRILNNFKNFKEKNPETSIPKSILLIYKKCIGEDIFDLYEGEDHEKFKPAVFDFLKLREQITKCENGEALVTLSMKSSNEESKQFLSPLGISIFEAKEVFKTLKQEEFFAVSFN